MFLYVVRICVSAYLLLQETPRLFRYQANESQSLPGSVGMVCFNCNYPDDVLRTSFLVGMTIRWKPTNAKARLVLLAWFVPIVTTLMMGYGLVS